jgi:hypothetical protein
MDILSVESAVRDGDYLLVEAVVDDMRMVRPQSYWDPAEYGPALCKGWLTLPEDCIGPLTDEQILELLNDSCIEWNTVDTSDYD